MEKIPTAKEVMAKHLNGVDTKRTAILDGMIEFARLHVEAALKAAEYCTEEYDFSVEIKNSYPLENIK